MFLWKKYFLQTLLWTVKGSRGRLTIFMAELFTAFNKRKPQSLLWPSVNPNCGRHLLQQKQFY